MEAESLEQCTKAAYSTFVEEVRVYAPLLAEMQMPWDLLGPTMKRAWTNAVEAALARSAESASKQGGSA